MNDKNNALFEVEDTKGKNPDEHVVHLKNQVKKTFDEKYIYLSKTKLRKFCKNIFFRFAMFCLAFPAFFKHNIKIKNRKYIRAIRKQKTGYVSISNHNLVLDCYANCLANLPKITYLPTVEETMKIPAIRHILKALNVIPIPSNPKGLVKFKDSVNSLLQNKKAVHFYPEGSLWPYYKELRPFKPGAFRFAVENNVPVLPYCIYFRERKGLWKLIGKKPLVTLEVLPAIFPDNTLPKKQAINALMQVAYEEMKIVIDSHLINTTVEELQEQEDMKKIIDELSNGITQNNLVLS